jgi:hypothetical protein
MADRDKLEREIHQLTQIIAADAFALASKSTPVADRAGLRKQIEIRSVLWAGLLKRLSGASNLSAAELRGPHAQRNEAERSGAHQGRIAPDPGGSAQAHQRDQAGPGDS